jgi:predicted DNA-binding transcriptional regulator AlpA
MPPFPKNQQRDADDDPALPMLARFTDLQDAGITNNWTHLTRLIKEENFPQGFLLSRNIRAWKVSDIRQWLAERPTARKTVPNKQKELETTA